jgi:uncharacterized protein
VPSAVVLDANVLVSAFVARSPTAMSRRALAVARARFTLCLSDAIEAELREVLLRPKFRRYGATPESVAAFLDGLAAADRVEPAERVTDCADADDNIYLEARLAGRATCIVTGDSDLLTLHPWRRIDILAPGDFVDRFAPVQGP